MAYQQSYRAVSNPVHGSVYSSTYNPLHQPSGLRKPANSTASNRSVSPLPAGASRIVTPTSQNQPTNQLSGPHSPQPSRPLSSFPPEQPSLATPSITPPVPDYQQPNYRQQPRAFYDSPASATSANFPQPPSHIPQKPQSEDQPQPPLQLQKPPQPRSSPAPSYTSNIHSIHSQDIDSALKACLRVQNDAVTYHSKRPFAALLLAPDNQTILLTHNSISHYQHAESELARLAGIQYNQKYLEKCTLVSTWEPCAMCAGTIYWTGIGRLIYAASESKLKELTGSNNEENMTMSLPCRTVFNSGQRNIEVIGPVPYWEEKVMAESGKWWRENQLSKIAEKGRHERERSVSANGPRSASGSIHEKASSITVYDPTDSFLGSIGEDGEYQADLKVDWMR